MFENGGGGGDAERVGAGDPGDAGGAAVQLAPGPSRLAVVRSEAGAAVQHVPTDGRVGRLARHVLHRPPQARRLPHSQGTHAHSIYVKFI